MAIKNIIRKILQLYYKFRVLNKAFSYKKPIYVNGFSSVNSNTELGKNVNFNGLTVIGNGKVEIGDNFHSGSGCLIITDVHDYDNGDCIPYDSQNYLVKDVHIEDNVWIGSRVIILGGVTLGEGSIIQAGAVVVNDIPKFGIAGGNPAAVFKERNKEHYKKLKSLGRFH